MNENVKYSTTATYTCVKCDKETTVVHEGNWASKSFLQGELKSQNWVRYPNGTVRCPNCRRTRGRKKNVLTSKQIGTLEVVSTLNGNCKRDNLNPGMVNTLMKKELIDEYESGNFKLTDKGKEALEAAQNGEEVVVTPSPVASNKSEKKMEKVSSGKKKKSKKKMEKKEKYPEEKTSRGDPWLRGDKTKTEEKVVSD